MKFIIIFILGLIILKSTKAQQVINGGFEDWDTTYIGSNIIAPLNWKTTGDYTIYFCYPSQPYVERTNDSYNGQWGCKLISKGCQPDGGSYQARIGLIAYGNNNFPKWLWGMPYHLRPDFFNFYYKFHSVGNDTGFARIVLRANDSAGYEGKIIGTANFSIIKDTDSYVYVSTPIDYLSMDTPDIIQIIFTNSKTVFNRSQIETPAGFGANIGTTLWIDEVNVSGGNIGINENYFPTLKVYPNPFNNKIEVVIPPDIYGNFIARVCNLEGKEIKFIRFTNIHLSEFKFQIDISEITQGVYFIEVSNLNNQFRKIIIKD